MSEFSDHRPLIERVDSHERYLSTHTTEIALLKEQSKSHASRLDVNEAIGGLKTKLVEMEATRREESSDLRNSIKALAEGQISMSREMARLADLNEEQMIKEASRADEAHRQQVALKDEEIKSLKSARENATLAGRIKAWATLAGGFTAIGAALVTVWEVVKYLLQNS